MAQAKLSKAAREYFKQCGKRGGHMGNHAVKGVASSPERAAAMAEINRTRRVKATHDETCWCDICRRYFQAKAKLKQLREGKVKV
ncbi:MAG: hypothetical protein ACYSW8_28825 [Planctomycetota bacterium]|jgi:hypothetical protein